MELEEKQPVGLGLNELDAPRWYHINPEKLFNANFNGGAWSGACNGHWKDARFM